MWVWLWNVSLIPEHYFIGVKQLAEVAYMKYHC